MEIYIDPITEEAFLEVGFISGYAGNIKVSMPVTDSYSDKQEAKLIKLNTTLLKKQEGLNKLNKDKVPKEVFDRLQAEIEGIQKDIENINKGVEIVRCKYIPENFSGKEREALDLGKDIAKLRMGIAKDIENLKREYEKLGLDW